MLPAYSNNAYEPDDDPHERRSMDDRYYNPRGRSDYEGGRRQRSRRREDSFEERGGRGIPRDRESHARGWDAPQRRREGASRDRERPQRDRGAWGGAGYDAMGGEAHGNRHQRERDEVSERFREYSGRGPDRSQAGRDRGQARSQEYEMQEASHRPAGRESRECGAEAALRRREFPRRQDFSVAIDDADGGYGGHGGWRPSHQSPPRAFRGADAGASRYTDRQPDHGYDGDEGDGRAGLQDMLPSQLDKNKGTLRLRPPRRQSSIRRETQVDENQPATEEEVLEVLRTLREQSWSMATRRKRRTEALRTLEQKHKKWYSARPVTSLVMQGSSTVSNIMQTLSPWGGILKRIEGRHGASVVAVFNFLRDMIQLNLLLLLLLIGGVVIPSSYFVSDDGGSQGFSWSLNDTRNLCVGIQLDFDNQTYDCNKNYTDMIQQEVDRSANDIIVLVGDFLQGSGFLEWTFLFSGRYPAAIESESYLVSLAYILTMLVVYFISIVYVVYFVAKFLRQSSVSQTDYGMTFSKIVFTGWDFTVSEKDAAEIERNLVVCEVKTAFDDVDYRSKQMSLTSRDLFKLYLTRFIINVATFSLIIGGWVAIYFMVIEQKNHVTGTDFEKFLWEYAPTILVSVFNFIYPLLFDFVIKFEHYSGRHELLITLSRCVLVRLTSLGILVITSLSVTSSGDRNCEKDNEYICWETRMGQQIYSVLVLDAIIQFGMTFVVNVLRRGLWRFDNKICKMVGRIEFYVPGHVLDVVYAQTLCWIGIIYAPLLAGASLINFFYMFLLKLFTVTVTCFPAERVFRASRSSAMFMTILSLALLMCVVSTGLALLLIKPSLACSPFRGLDYAWEALTYYVCRLDNSSDSWIRVVLFTLDDMAAAVVLLVVVVLLATYYISLVKARGSLIRRLEDKLKITTKEKNYLMMQYNRLSPSGTSN
ncbi:transmembrane channel-like protein 7 [Penaeus vannamei]|uniref:transmembrane channel-like protein 7 n=1 Tax=Penaeus vannamei TaxID=6689 RepID=UPI00387F3FA2